MNSKNASTTPDEKSCCNSPKSLWISPIVVEDRNLVNDHEHRKMFNLANHGSRSNEQEIPKTLINGGGDVGARTHGSLLANHAGRVVPKDSRCNHQRNQGYSEIWLMLGGAIRNVNGVKFRPVHLDDQRREDPGSTLQVSSTLSESPMLIPYTILVKIQCIGGATSV